MSVSDDKVSRLAISGFTEGTTTDREVFWLKDRVVWEAGDASALAGLWGLYLELQGFSGTNADARYAWLGSLGFTGAISDRLAAFWASGEVLP